MAISDLTNVTTPADTDIFWGEQGATFGPTVPGTDFRWTRAQIVAGVAADLAAEISATDAEITALESTRIKKDGTIAMTGALTLSGAPSSNLHAATKAYTDTADALKAPLASPTFTGVPAAPTAADGTSTTQVATTAFVANQLDEYLFERTAITGATATLTEDQAGYIGVDRVGTVGLTLPTISALSNPGRVFYRIKDEGFNANATTQLITITRGGSDTIENAATAVTISTAGEDVFIYNDGVSAWYLSAVDTPASTTAVGKVELLTDAEALVLTDTTRAMTAANLAAVLDVELYKTTELGAASKTMAEADAGTWYVSYTNTGAVAITLPDPSGLTDATKCVYEIVDAGAAATNNITITSAGSATLDGTSSAVITATRAGMKFFNDGTNWITTANTQNAVNAAVSAAGTTPTTFSALSGPGAVPVTQYRHRLTTTGTADAITLANGTNGQKILITYVAEGASGDSAVLTPASLLGYTTITFNDIADSAELMYDSTSAAWLIINVFNATVA